MVGARPTDSLIVLIAEPKEPKNGLAVHGRSHTGEAPRAKATVVESEWVSVRKLPAVAGMSDH